MSIGAGNSEVQSPRGRLQDKWSSIGPFEAIWVGHNYSQVTARRNYTYDEFFLLAVISVGSNPLKHAH